jgi:hypothetical protein
MMIVRLHIPSFLLGAFVYHLWYTNNTPETTKVEETA